MEYTTFRYWHDVRIQSLYLGQYMRNVPYWFNFNIGSILHQYGCATREYSPSATVRLRTSVSSSKFRHWVERMFSYSELCLSGCVSQDRTSSRKWTGLCWSRKTWRTSARTRNRSCMWGLGWSLQIRNRSVGRQPGYGVECADENHGLDDVGLNRVRLGMTVAWSGGAVAGHDSCL